MGIQFPVEILELFIGHPADNQVLPDRGAHVAVGIAFGQIGHQQHLLGGDVARRQSQDGCGKSILPLFHHVGASPGRERRGRSPVGVTAIAVAPILRRHDQGSRVGMREELDRRMRGLRAEHLFIGGFPSAFEFFKPQFLDHELHAGFAAVLAIAEIVEDLDDGFDGRDEVVHGYEFPEQMRDARCRAQSAADHHAESDRAVFGLLRQ